MEQKSKISKKKVKRFFGMLLLLTVFGAIMVAANKRQADESIKKVIVTLKNQANEEHFLRVDDVETLIEKQGVNVADETIASINVEEIERIVRANPWVKNAEVYVDNKANLNIEVVQRSPVARVFTTGGSSFYLDNEAFEMPLSHRYAYSVPVFTNYMPSRSDSINDLMKQNIVHISQVVFEDTFWNTQITQIEMNGVNNFNCYTTLGGQVVKLGDTADIALKLNNLLSFYHEVSNKIGWDRYEVLDVRFKGQVVASPSIGWIPPRDTALATQTAIAPKAGPVVNAKPEPKVPDVKKMEAKPVVQAKNADIKKPEAKKTAVQKNKDVLKPAAKEAPAAKAEKAKPKVVEKATSKQAATNVKKKKEQKK
jgi:cell division protein FtsQ